MQGLAPAVQKALQPLSVQHRKFVMNYCSRARGNATLAMKQAGYKGAYATLASNASRLMLEPEIRAAIDAWMDAYGVNAIRTTAMIADLAEANIGPFMQVKDGALHMKENITEEEWEAHKHWVEEVELDGKGKVIRVKAYSRIRALDLLAKINKLYSDAPVFQAHYHLSRLPDDEVLELYKQVMAAEGTPGEHPALPPGGPVAVVEAGGGG